MRRPEVGLDHLGIALHLRGPAFSDLLAVVEHHHAIAHVHHQAHIVLDQQHRYATRANGRDELAQGNAFGGVHACRGLVQRKQLRVGRESPRDFQPPLVAIRQAAGGVVCPCPDAHVAEKLERARLDCTLLGQRRARLAHGADDAGAGAHVAADHNVLQRRQVREQANVLEGSRDASGGDAVGREAGDVACAEREAAVVGGVHPSGEVEQGGLAGTVRANQAEDFGRLNVEGNLAQGLEATETLADAPPLEQRRHSGWHAGAWLRSASSRRRTAEGSRPAGRNSMISTSASPNSSMRMTSGSTTMRPNNACCAGSTVQRRTSGTNESSSAPRITPQTLPMPPSTTIDTTMIDSTSTKLSGEMKAWMAENMPPATPPKLAPIANASSFMLRVLIPIARAAISSSRIASHARPTREFCRRTLTTMTPSTTASSR